LKVANSGIPERPVSSTGGQDASLRTGWTCPRTGLAALSRPRSDGQPSTGQEAPPGVVIQYPVPQGGKVSDERPPVSRQRLGRSDGRFVQKRRGESWVTPTSKPSQDVSIGRFRKETALSCDDPVPATGSLRTDAQTEGNSPVVQRITSRSTASDGQFSDTCWSSDTGRAGDAPMPALACGAGLGGGPEIVGPLQVPEPPSGCCDRTP
jgi:hypothetical protein